MIFFNFQIYLANKNKCYPYFSFLEWEGPGGLYDHHLSLFKGFIMYFQLVFDMLVLQKHNTEMTTAAGEAFYTLVCLHQVPHVCFFMGLFLFI